MMETEPEEQNQKGTVRPSFLMRTHLFDGYEVPWTSRWSLGWTYFVFVTFGVPLGPLLGLYLGLWLVAKHRSAASLLVYLVAVGCIVAALIPGVPHDVISARELEWAALALWFVGAFTLRHQVKNLYWEVDRTCLNLGYVFTALFGPWYVNYQLRPMWPV
jgi:hypothetical protein